MGWKRCDLKAHGDEVCDGNSVEGTLTSSCYSTLPRGCWMMVKGKTSISKGELAFVRVPRFDYEEAVYKSLNVEEQELVSA